MFPSTSLVYLLVIYIQNLTWFHRKRIFTDAFYLLCCRSKLFQQTLLLACILPLGADGFLFLFFPVFLLRTSNQKVYLHVDCYSPRLLRSECCIQYSWSFPLIITGDIVGCCISALCRLSQLRVFFKHALALCAVRFSPLSHLDTILLINR